MKSKKILALLLLSFGGFLTFTPPVESNPFGPGYYQRDNPFGSGYVQEDNPFGKKHEICIYCKFLNTRQMHL